MRSLFVVTYGCLIIMLSSFALVATAPLLKYGAPSFDKNWFPNDFIIPYLASRIAISKNRQLIYDRSTQLETLNEITAPFRFTEQSFCFEYPPYAFLFVIPLAFMPFHLAYRVFQLVTWIFGAFIFIRYFCRPLGWNFWQSLSLVVCATFSYPVWLGIVAGQYHWIFFGLFSLFYRGILQGSQTMAGISLAFSSVKAQCVPVHGLVALVLGYKRLLIVSALSVFLMLLVTWCVFGLDAILEYPNVLLNAETSKEIVGSFPAFQICLRGLFVRCFGERVAAYLSIIFYIFALIAVAYIWAKAKNRDRFVKQWALALTIMLQLVFALHMHEYDCLFIAFTVPLTLPAQSQKIMLSKGRAPIAYIVWLSLVFAYPFLSWFQTAIDAHANGNTFFLASNMLLLIACAICWHHSLSLSQMQESESSS